jgi:hypothetical protein
MIEANLERTFAADRYKQMGGYVKRMAGVRIFIRAESAGGHCVDRMYLEDGPIDDQRVYPCAFITEQGVSAKFGVNRQALDVHAIDALRQRLRRPWPGELRPSEAVLEI